MNTAKPHSNATFSLKISKQSYLQYYQGSANSIVVKDVSGKIIRFPASMVREFVTHNGIHGIFCIKYDENHKFISIEQID